MRVTAAMEPLAHRPPTRPDSRLATCALAGQKYHSTMRDSKAERVEVHYRAARECRLLKRA
jgi:hypothetical protein